MVKRAALEIYAAHGRETSMQRSRPTPDHRDTLANNNETNTVCSQRDEAKLLCILQKSRLLPFLCLDEQRLLPVFIIRLEG